MSAFDPLHVLHAACYSQADMDAAVAKARDEVWEKAIVFAQDYKRDDTTVAAQQVNVAVSGIIYDLVSARKQEGK